MVSLPACLRAGSLNYAENKREKWNRERERWGTCRPGSPKRGLLHHLSVHSGVTVLPFLVSSELTCCFERLSSPTIPEVLEAGVDSARWKECQLPFQPNGNICIGKGQSLLAKNILTGGSRRGSPHVCWKRGRCTGHRGLPKLGRARRGWGNLSARCPLPPALGARSSFRGSGQARSASGSHEMAVSLYACGPAGAWAAQSGAGGGEGRERARVGGTCLTDGGAAGPGAAESLELALSWICLSFPVCTQGKSLGCLILDPAPQAMRPVGWW